MKDNDSKMNRRRSLQVFGATLAAGGLYLLGCNKDNGGSGGAGGGGTASNGGGGGAADCKSQIDEASKNTRRTLQYNDKATDSTKMCKNCAQFEAGKYKECGGGCKVITGPVKPEGGCLAFAPKAADGGPPT